MNFATNSHILLIYQIHHILPKNIKQKVISNLNKISKIFKLKSGILHVNSSKIKIEFFYRSN